MNLRRLVMILPLASLLLAAGAWYWLLYTQPGARWIWGLAVTATDDALRTSSVSGDLAAGVTMRGFEFDGNGINISVNNLMFNLDVDLLPLRATIGSVQASGVYVQVADRAATDNEATDVREILGSLQLPIELIVSDVAISDARFSGPTVDEAIVVNTLTFAGRWQDDVEINELELVMPEVNIRADGGFELAPPNRLTVAADIDLPPWLTGFEETLSIALDASGTLDDLGVVATTAAPEAKLSGSIAGIVDDINWNLQLEMSGFSLPPNLDLPELPPVRIAADGEGDLRSFAATVDLGFTGTDMQLGLAATVDVESSALTGDLQWRNAHWPVGEAEPQLASRTGRVDLSGSLDEWSVSGTLEVDVPQLPPGQLTIDGRGDRDRAAVEILDGDVLGGAIAGRADYSWRGSRAYSAQLDLSDVHTSALLPDWPAVLNGRVDISGQQIPFEFSAVIIDVNGEFKDMPLHANGRIDIRDNTVSVNDLRLRHGDSSARIDGRPYAENGLYFDVAIDELGHYVEHAFGSLSAIGQVSLNADHPFLRIDASSQVIEYADLRITDLAVHDGSSDASILDADITVGAFTYADIHVNDLLVQTRMNRQSQTLDLGMEFNGIVAGLSMAGALDNWQQASSWTGQINRLDLDHQEFSAALAKAADVVLTKQSVDVRSVCLVGEQGIRLCADGGWRGSEGFDVMASLSSVPVDLVNAFFDTRLKFDQLVNGDFSWRMNADARSTGRADIAISAGTIVGVDRPDLMVETAQGEVSFNVDDDSLRSGVVRLPIRNLGQVAAEFEVLDVAGDGSAEILGMIDIDLADIELAATFLPAIDNAGGSLTADLRISGTVSSPAIEGDILFENGTLSYLPIGLELDDIALQSELQNDGEIEVSGSFRAGEGQGRIRSRTDQSNTAARGLELRLQGKNLTIIDTPDIQAVANADVGIDFDGETLGLDGRIEIPRARVTPTNIGQGQVSESEDVIIVAGELPEDSTDAAPEGGLQIMGAMEIAFGDDVVVDLDLAEATLGGSTVFNWSGGPMPMANGRYNVDGEILAFGQKLEITQGSVRFPDVPADDPYLRIRAEREIYGNTEVRRAGVLVSGTISRPTIEAYTNPLTTEERALTLLVTGSDFDYEKGVGAVDFGTYIAPRVYASYGIGLFDTENVIRVRYDLKRGFGITGTSGQRDSGVDLSYRFEN